MWHWMFLEIIFGLIYAAVSVIPECPAREDIYPCSCLHDYEETRIDCEGVDDIKKINGALKSTRGLNVTYVFWKTNLGDIPSNFFEGQKSTSISFDQCEIGSFGDKPFTGLENILKRLYIDASVDKREKDLKTFPLGHLRKLEYLIFSGNDITKLGNDWFTGGPTTLKHLFLEANDIEELGDKAFASLVNVEQIWMGENKFKKVSRSMFARPASKLELLEMSFSGIEELPADIFEDMPVLKSINVAGNKLESVPEGTWGKIWNQLDEVYLERNSGFKCDDRIKWIYKRRLPRILRGKCSSGKLAGKNLSDLTLSDFP